MMASYAHSLYHRRGRASSTWARGSIVSHHSMFSSPASRHRLGAACLLVVAACLTGCPGCQPGKPALPPSYQEKVSTFTIGTVALQTGDQSGHDRTYLTKASQIAPGEPAVWA